MRSPWMVISPMMRLVTSLSFTGAVKLLSISYENTEGQEMDFQIMIGDPASSVEIYDITNKTDVDIKSAAKRNAEVVSLTQEMETCIPDETRERELDSRELGRILDAFLRTLSDENQMVFLRRYWYVDTIAEIAVRYGISESAVQMRLIRTRSKLAEYLAKEDIKV